jgi:putative ABC transport system permease protein
MRPFSVRARPGTRFVKLLTAMSELLQDLRFTARTLLRNPSFTALAALTLALGIGAGTTVFSVFHAVLLARLPYSDPERIAMVWEKRPRENVFDNSVAPADYLDWRARNDVFEFMAALENTSADLVGRGEPERLEAGRVTADFFKVLGVRPQLGRLFEPGDDQAGRDDVAVLTHALWQRRFGGDAAVVGTAIDLGGRKHRVIGVLPASFRFPKRAELWLPFAFPPNFAFVRAVHFLDVYARLRPGVTLEQARAAMNTLGDRLSQEHPATNRYHGSHVVPLREELVSGVRPMLVALLSAVAFLVLIACANVANLLLARGSARQRELQIRSALGASRARLLKLLLAESLCLSGLAGFAGVLLAVWGADLLKLIVPALPTVGLDDFAVNRPVLAFAVLLSLAASLASGLLPAYTATRVELHGGFKESSRSTPGRTSRRVRAALVAAQVALSVVLLGGAGLMIRTLQRLLEVAPGFESERVLTFTLDLPAGRYGSGERIVALYSQLLERVRRLPGVVGAGGISQLALLGRDSRTAVDIEGREPRPGEPNRMHSRNVTTGYFETLRIALRAGRLPDERDDGNAPPVLLVNETAARRYWPSGDAVGKRVRLGGSQQWREVVGVVGDVKHWGLDESVRPEMYLPEPQAPTPYLSVVVRSSLEPQALVGAVRQQLRAVDKDLPLGQALTLDEVVGQSLAPRRFFLRLLAGFAALALLLATMGIYAVTALSVAQRTHEIGVRVSLGARLSDIRRLVLGEGLKMTAVGLAFGLAAAAALGRSIEDQLFGVQRGDPITLGAVTIVLVAAALLASYVPARRAARVDPGVALRCE